jgi:sterol desaturase/sphingolipid hydroxylase (fatty acid hydroxylase superfamily)
MTYTPAVKSGGKKNYSPTFSFWDVIFGTFYMPAGKLPQEYGNGQPDFPKDFIGQMIVPFKQFVQNMPKKR